MEIFVGTSGWSNPIWNPNGLTWYQNHSRLNAVELSMSFHQLPTKAQVSQWALESKNLLWSVKVNRSITHFFRFNSIAREKYHEFKELFLPLDQRISHYLFQLPPNAHPSIRNEIESFFEFTGLKSRFAIEWRNPKWFSKEHLAWAKELSMTVVSVDGSTSSRDIINTSKTVYLRLHGRSDWFEHHYSRKELSHIASLVANSGAERVIAYLNNDSSQLKNARVLRAMLELHQGGADELTAENMSE